jgi:hypothetical protein
MTSFQLPANVSRRTLACTFVIFLSIVGSVLLHSRRIRRAGVANSITTQKGTHVVRTPALRVTGIVQHGRIVEIKGSTDAGAVVMINGEAVPTIFDGNEFRHFLGPLASGTSIITITCQNAEGGVNTQRLAITIE